MCMHQGMAMVNFFISFKLTLNWFFCDCRTVNRRSQTSFRHWSGSQEKGQSTDLYLLRRSTDVKTRMRIVRVCVDMTTVFAVKRNRGSCHFKTCTWQLFVSASVSVSPVSTIWRNSEVAGILSLAAAHAAEVVLVLASAILDVVLVWIQIVGSMTDRLLD